ncbi:MAG: aspartyl protease family protein [Gemmataceae bacterium]
MSLIFPYIPLRVRTPAVSLGGRLTRPRPIIPISLIGPLQTRIVRGLLDTGADDTVFSEQVARAIGIDLTNAPEAEFGGVGGTAVARVRYAQVTLRLATNTEQREWVATAGFTNAPLRFALLGFAGALQFFTATFRGDREEVDLQINSLYAGS